MLQTANYRFQLTAVMAFNTIENAKQAVKQGVENFMAEQKAAGMAEYVLIAIGVAVAAAAAFAALGGRVIQQTDSILR